MISTDFETRQRAIAWYAVYTRYRHEKNVELILRSKGFETFLPLFEAQHRWVDRLKVVSLPLFPCYVFLQSDLKRPLEILTTPGIHNFVLSAGEPARIPADEIESVRRSVESGAKMEPHEFLTIGDRVRVKTGPLEGIEGILVRKKNLYRLLLSVEMLGKSVSVEIGTAQVEGSKESAGLAVLQAAHRTLPTDVFHARTVGQEARVGSAQGAQ